MKKVLKGKKANEYEIEKIFEELRKYITKNYGRKCKDYEDGCCVCRVWFLYENLKDYMKLADVENKK